MKLLVQKLLEIHWCYNKFMVDGTGPPPSELGITPKDMGLSPTPEPTVNDELTNRLNEIDASIIERHVHSKFRGEVVLRGKSVRGPGSPFLDEILPNDVNYTRDLDPTGQFAALHGLVRKGIFDPRFATKLERLLGNSHVFAVLDDKDNPSLGTLQFIYPVEGVDNANRRFLTLEVFLKMPEEKLGELVRILTRNPDAVEQFYQMSTDGLDNSVQRKKSSQVVGIDLKKFMPLERFQGSNVSISQLLDSPPGQEKLDLNRLKVLQYTRPQGQFSQEEINEEFKRISEEDRLKREIAQKAKEAQIPTPASTTNPEVKKVISPKYTQATRPSMFAGGPLEGLPNLVRRIFGPKG